MVNRGSLKVSGEIRYLGPVNFDQGFYILNFETKITLLNGLVLL